MIRCIHFGAGISFYAPGILLKDIQLMNICVVLERRQLQMKTENCTQQVPVFLCLAKNSISSVSFRNIFWITGKFLILLSAGQTGCSPAQVNGQAISDPRNKAVMKMFSMINVGERAGSGVPNIIQTWNNENWIEPEIDEQFNPDRTILTFKTRFTDFASPSHRPAALRASVASAMLLSEADLASLASQDL